MEPLLPAVPHQRPLLTTLNIVLAVKERCLRVQSIITEQVMKDTLGDERQCISHWLTILVVVNLVKALKMFNFHDRPQRGFMGYTAGKLCKGFQRAHSLERMSPWSDLPGRRLGMQVWVGSNHLDSVLPER